MTVIAITHEMGSLGPEVCAALAGRLRLRHVRYTLSEHKEPDVASSQAMLHKILADHVRKRDAGSSVAVHRHDAPHPMTEVELIAYALEGDVLLEGVGAGIVLAPVAHVLRVRLCAPMTERVRRIAHRSQLLDARAAEAIAEAADAGLVRNGHRLFGAQVKNAYLYDLVLNTARLDVPACVMQVAVLAMAPCYQATIASTRILEDLHLEAQARVARFTDLETDCDEDLADAAASDDAAVETHAGDVVDPTGCQGPAPGGS